MDAVVRANGIVECEEVNEGRAFPICSSQSARYQNLRRAALACRPSIVQSRSQGQARNTTSETVLPARADDDYHKNSSIVLTSILN